MHLFSEPTYRQRLADFSERVGVRITERFSDTTDTEMARGLGWASIAIGMTEVLAPRQVENMLGLEDTPDRRGTLRVLGVREICHGIGILTEEEASDRMRAGVWARVAGDVLDSALLGVAATKTKGPFAFAVITAMVMGIGLADLLCARRLSDEA
jgi:hypothetical protein